MALPLRYLRLHDVKGFAGLEVDFTGRRRRVLLGQNGTGKSTVLRALGLALAGTDALLPLLGPPRDWVRRGAAEARIEVGFAANGGAEHQVEIRFGPEDSASDVVKRNLLALETLDHALKRAESSWFVAGYGASRRLGSDVPTSTLPPRAAAVATLFSAEASLIPLRSTVVDAHYRRGDQVLTLLAGALDRLLPGVRFAGVDREERELLFDTPDGRLPLRSLSDGFQNAIAWTGDLLFRLLRVFPDSPTPFEAPGLLLVDEVDLHLHPVWQRQLFRFLDDVLPHLQLVVTTHSPLTAQQAREGELLALERRAEGVVAVDFRGDPQNLLVHQVLLHPVFGIGDAASYTVEEQKRRYTVLLGQPTRTEGEERELKGLARSLRDRPLWSGRAPRKRKADG